MALARALLTNGSLTYLGLSTRKLDRVDRNKVQEKGGMEFGRAIAKNRTLVTLNLSKTRDRTHRR